MGIIMLAGVMAMYSGQSITFETNLTNPVYTVTGNSSNLEGLNITFENRNITISPAVNYKPDNFTLIFFDNITNEVIKTVTNNVYAGGGGGSTKYIDKNVTVYVPKYINQTIEKEIEVEKIVEEVKYIEREYKLWERGIELIGVIFLIVIGIGLGFYIKNKRKNRGKEEDSIKEYE